MNRRGARSGLRALIALTLLGVALISARAQDSPGSQPAAAPSTDPRQSQPKLLVDALFAKHHHRANQDPEWALGTAGCLDSLSDARPYDIEAHEEAERLRSGQGTPETADKINAAAAQRNDGIERYHACLRGAATFTLPASPSPTLYAKIGRFIEIATSKAVDGLIRVLEERFGRGTSAGAGAGAGGNRAPGARQPTDIPPEHLPLYYASPNRPEPVNEFAHGLSKGFWAAEVEDLPYALVNPAQKLKKYQRLAGTVAALSAGNSVADLYDQLQRLDPSAPKFDLGYRAARILRQGVHLRDVAKQYPRRPSSVAGASGAKHALKTVPDRTAPPPLAGGATIHAPSGYVLGKELGHGSFGKVYELIGQPSKVLKQVWVEPNNPFSGRASVRRQQSGHDLLARINADPTKPAAKDPIPMTTVHEAHTPPGRDPYLVMEHATEAPRWKAKGAYVKTKGEDLTPDEQKAMRELGGKLADNGLVWSDPNAGNVSFFTENGVLKAAIIDHDFIFPAKRAEAIAESMRLKLNSLKNPNDPSAVNKVLSAEQRVMFNKLTSSKPSLHWLDSYLKGGPFSAGGFMDAMASANGYR